MLRASTTARSRSPTPSGNAVWHQDHTFTCFAFPTFTEEDCRQIGAALAKVIRAYAK